LKFQDNPEDMGSIDSCEYIWEAGVGFTHSPAVNATYDHNRTELLKLLLTCFSETMYLPPVRKSQLSYIDHIIYLLGTLFDKHVSPSQPTDLRQYIHDFITIIIS
jgi:High-temperature-induced dauer-formation protein